MSAKFKRPWKFLIKYDPHQEMWNLRKIWRVDDPVVYTGKSAPEEIRLSLPFMGETGYLNPPDYVGGSIEALREYLVTFFPGSRTWVDPGEGSVLLGVLEIPHNRP